MSSFLIILDFWYRFAYFSVMVNVKRFYNAHALLSSCETAAHARVSARTVRWHVKRGFLHPYKSRAYGSGRNYIFQFSEVERWLRESRPRARSSGKE